MTEAIGKRRATDVLSGVEDLRLGDFWAWAYSDLLCNTVRPLLAEFLVAAALEVTDGVRVEWDHVDVIWQGSKIEVKSAGYLQSRSWKQKALSKPRFDIEAKCGWDAATGHSAGAPIRAADCYVFALHTDQEQESADPADVTRWLFYVIPTATVNERFGSQKSVALSRVEAVAAPLSFSELGKSIAAALGARQS